jgi:hypothetical protein
MTPSIGRLHYPEIRGECWTRPSLRYMPKESSHLFGWAVVGYEGIFGAIIFRDLILHDLLYIILH